MSKIEEMTEDATENTATESSGSVAALVAEIEKSKTDLLETRALKAFQRSCEKRELTALAADMGVMIADRADGAAKVSKLKRSLRILEPENPAAK